MNILRRIIPTIIARITGKERYLPAIEWSSKSWTHNVFRLYELICWRQYGIRAEASVGLKAITVKGKEKSLVVYEYYTFEAMCAGFEGRLRKFLVKVKNFDLSFELPFRLYVCKMQPINGADTGVFGSPYLFAIAYDSVGPTGSTSGAGSTHTFSITCSGSDRIIWTIGVCHRTAAVPGQAVSSVTYNGVSLTQSVHLSDDGGNSQLYLHHLVAPSTGANNVVITTAVATHARGGGATSFTGASQTGVPDATSTNTSGATTSYSQSVTSVADNCFAILGGGAFGGLTLTGGSNTSIASQPEVTFHGTFMAYSTAPKTPAGTFTLNVTCTSQAFGGVMASFKPVAGTAYTTERTETVTSTDTRIMSITRSISETVTNADTIFKNTIRNITETITNSDVFSSIMIFYKELSESVSSADTIFKDTVRNITEYVTNNDTIAKLTNKIISETTSVADTFTTYIVKLITLTETLTVIEDFRMFLNSRVARWRDKYNESKTQDWVEKQDL